jgi:hypothetical protein
VHEVGGKSDLMGLVYDGALPAVFVRGRLLVRLNGLMVSLVRLFTFTIQRAVIIQIDAQLFCSCNWKF